MTWSKLLLIIGVLLIATLDETEGRRRWFKRKHKTVGCSNLDNINTAVANSNVLVSPNSNVRNNRGPNNCVGENCVGIVNPAHRSNVREDRLTRKMSRLMRRNERRQCQRERRERRRGFMGLANKVEGTNSTRTKVPNINNTGRQQHGRGNRKCKGRRMRNGVCQLPQDHDDDPNEEESNANSIGNELDRVAIEVGEPKQNIL